MLYNEDAIGRIQHVLTWDIKKHVATHIEYIFETMIGFWGLLSDFAWFKISEGSHTGSFR